MAPWTPPLSSIVIDLTQSDDEDELTTYSEVPRPGALQSPSIGLPHAFPVSNHPLALRNDIPSGSGPGESTKPLGLAGVGTARFPPSFHGGVHPMQKSGNRTTRRTTEQSFPRLPTRAEDGDIPLANTAKRRKTHGGLTSSVLSQRITQGHMNKDGQDNKIQPVKTRAESTISSSSDASIIEIITSRPNLDESQVSTQPSEHAANPPANTINHESRERVVHVLENHVLRYVQSALRKFRGTLSKTELRVIGEKAARKIIDDPRFFKDFQANEWVLTKGYEANLRARATRYVDKLASRASGNSRESQRLTSTSPGSHDSRGVTLSSHESQDGDSITVDDSVSLNLPDVTYDSYASINDSGNVVKDRDSSSASPSYDELQIFDDTSKSMPRYYNSQQAPTNDDYYSSPPTSFSNEPAAGASQVDFEPSESKPVIQHTTPEQPRRSTRLSRNGRSTRRYFKTKTRAKTAVKVENDNDISSKIKKPSIASIREAQALRLSGLDPVARPYISFADLEDIRRGFKAIRGQVEKHFSEAERELLQESVLHVDFCLEEVELLYGVVVAVTRSKAATYTDSKTLKSQLISIMDDEDQSIPAICKAIERRARNGGEALGWHLLRSRDTSSICAFLEDAAAGHVTIMSRFTSIDFSLRQNTGLPKPSISTLLGERAAWGMAPFRVCRGHQTFNVEIANYIEDTFVRRSEWTDCCGDISAVSWTGDNTFICGATAHSDYHNMQYNKPGNLLVGSTSLDTLRAVDGHRIVRPIIDSAENAENALASMRQTQDPWLYTSVVSTAHSSVSDHTFTASFDRTVKVWKVSEDGSTMDLRGIWNHDGNVNFVVTSENHKGVATASDVSNNAIRVYKFDEQDIQGTTYETYSGDRAQDQTAGLERDDPWAYFPATIQWGRAPSVENLLLVGYSPRSISGHETDIPEEKKNSGELCIWDVRDGRRIPVLSARTQNAFEVIWHPSQPMFLAATSPCGGNFEPEVKTQIRLFAPNQSGDSFQSIRTLDCPAIDINELTLRPLGMTACYITASCTDGNTYVWDTVQGDHPIHVLGHGDSLDNPIHDLPREIADSGVKFASWGQTSGRFYTGSSDGKVKAWDVRAPKGDAFVRTVLSVSGGISAGAFSRDFSKLLIGDATGKVHLIEADDSDLEDDTVSGEALAPTANKSLVIPSKDGNGQPVRRPKVLIPHPEPLPPDGFVPGIEGQEQTAQSMAHNYIEEGQLSIHPDRRIGVVQGPNYAETHFHRYEAHENYDAVNPLRPEWEARQQYHLQGKVLPLQLPRLPDVESSNLELHMKNMALDLDVSRLPESVKESLKQDGVDLKFEESHTFDLEPTPRYEIFQLPEVIPFSNLS